MVNDVTTRVKYKTNNDKLCTIIIAATVMIAFFSVSVSCLWYGSSSDKEEEEYLS